MNESEALRGAARRPSNGSSYPSRRADIALERCRQPARLITRPSFHQRALSILQRPERLIRRDRRAHLVVVPWTLGFGWLLHLDEVRRVDLAAVDADRPLAEQRIVGGHFLHLGDDFRAVVALQRLDRLQV